MQLRSKITQITAATIGLVFFTAIPAFAYTTVTNTNGSYSTNGGYYSTRYGWVGTRPAPKPIPPPTTKPNPPPVQPPPVQPPAPTGTISAEETQMVNLVNQERAKAGLGPLTVNLQLVQIARIKSQDMITSNYFGHTSPNFGSTFTLINQRGLSYTSGGENLAGAGNVATAHSMLMNSAGHRANILGPRYNRIGIGIVRGGPYGAMFTQLFLG